MDLARPGIADLAERGLGLAEGTLARDDHAHSRDYEVQAPAGSTAMWAAALRGNRGVMR
jgi:hypothetical protein